MSNTFKFLLMGAGRGGTSLLHAMLQHHSQLDVAYEQFAAILMQEAVAPKENLLSQRVSHFIAACEAEAQQHSMYWGNKITSEQLLGLAEHNQFSPDVQQDIIDYFFHQGLQNKKVIFILRDGRTCVRSKMQRTGQSLEQACERWRFSVKIYRFLDQHYPNSLSIKYEDLLINPEFVLTKICEFLEIKFESAMLDGTYTAQTPAEYQQNFLDTSKLRLNDIPKGCEDLIKEDLEYCAYNIGSSD